MNEQATNPSLPVVVYSDYICPFCYIGFLRLEKLRAEYPLDIAWRFLEIHPDNPPGGKPISELGYPPRHWEMLMANLERMAREEGVTLPERTFTTNSRLALKLAQAVRAQQPAAFDALNRALYEAYFLERRNIGDREVLSAVAESCDIATATMDSAWRDERYETVLEENQRSAARLGITGTPTYVFGQQVYSGAIPLDMLRRAAGELAGR